MTFDQVMELTRKVSHETAFSEKECAKLYELCSEQQSLGTVVEIGCQLGRTSSVIAQVGKTVGYHSIHIDPFMSQPGWAQDWIKMMHSIEHPFIFLCMRTDQTRRELDQLCPQGIDLLLIDGDHTTAGVYADCRFAAERVRKNGIMLAHDYQRPGLPEVREVIDQYAIAPDWEHIGVYDSLGAWKRC